MLRLTDCAPLGVPYAYVPIGRKGGVPNAWRSARGKTAMARPRHDPKREIYTVWDAEDNMEYYTESDLDRQTLFQKNSPQTVWRPLLYGHPYYAKGKWHTWAGKISAIRRAGAEFVCIEDGLRIFVTPRPELPQRPPVTQQQRRAHDTAVPPEAVWNVMLPPPVGTDDPRIVRISEPVVGYEGIFFVDRQMWQLYEWHSDAWHAYVPTTPGFVGMGDNTQWKRVGVQTDNINFYWRDPVTCGAHRIEEGKGFTEWTHKYDLLKKELVAHIDSDSFVYAGSKVDLKTGLKDLRKFMKGGFHALIAAIDAHAPPPSSEDAQEPVIRAGTERHRLLKPPIKVTGGSLRAKIEAFYHTLTETRTEAFTWRPLLQLPVPLDTGLTQWVLPGLMAGELVVLSPEDVSPHDTRRTAFAARPSVHVTDVCAFWVDCCGGWRQYKLDLERLHDKPPPDLSKLAESKGVGGWRRAPNVIERDRADTEWHITKAAESGMRIAAEQARLVSGAARDMRFRRQVATGYTRHRPLTLMSDPLQWSLPAGTAYYRITAKTARDLEFFVVQAVDVVKETDPRREELALIEKEGVRAGSLSVRAAPGGAPVALGAAMLGVRGDDDPRNMRRQEDRQNRREAGDEGREEGARQRAARRTRDSTLEDDGYADGRSTAEVLKEISETVAFVMRNSKPMHSVTSSDGGSMWQLLYTNAEGAGPTFFDSVWQSLEEWYKQHLYISSDMRGFLSAWELQNYATCSDILLEFLDEPNNWDLDILAIEKVYGFVKFEDNVRQQLHNLPGTLGVEAGVLLCAFLKVEVRFHILTDPDVKVASPYKQAPFVSGGLPFDTDLQFPRIHMLVMEGREHSMRFGCLIDWGHHIEFGIKRGVSEQIAQYEADPSSWDRLEYLRMMRSTGIYVPPQSKRATYREYMPAYPSAKGDANHEGDQVYSTQGRLMKEFTGEMEACAVAVREQKWTNYSFFASCRDACAERMGLDEQSFPGLYTFMFVWLKFLWDKDSGKDGFSRAGTMPTRTLVDALLAPLAAGGDLVLSMEMLRTLTLYGIPKSALGGSRAYASTHSILFPKFFVCEDHEGTLTFVSATTLSIGVEDDRVVKVPLLTLVSRGLDSKGNRPVVATYYHLLCALEPRIPVPGYKWTRPVWKDNDVYDRVRDGARRVARERELEKIEEENARNARYEKRVRDNEDKREAERRRKLVDPSIEHRDKYAAEQRTREAEDRANLVREDRERKEQEARDAMRREEEKEVRKAAAERLFNEAKERFKEETRERDEAATETHQEEDEASRQRRVEEAAIRYEAAQRRFEMAQAQHDAETKAGGMRACMLGVLPVEAETRHPIPPVIIPSAWVPTREEKAARAASVYKLTLRERKSAAAVISNNGFPQWKYFHGLPDLEYLDALPRRNAYAFQSADAQDREAEVAHEIGSVYALRDSWYQIDISKAVRPVKDQPPGPAPLLPKPDADDPDAIAKEGVFDSAQSALNPTPRSAPKKRGTKNDSSVEDRLKTLRNALKLSGHAVQNMGLLDFARLLNSGKFDFNNFLGADGEEAGEKAVEEAPPAPPVPETEEEAFDRMVKSVEIQSRKRVTFVLRVMASFRDRRRKERAFHQNRVRWAYNRTRRQEEDHELRDYHPYDRAEAVSARQQADDALHAHEEALVAQHEYEKKLTLREWVKLEKQREQEFMEQQLQAASLFYEQHIKGKRYAMRHAEKEEVSEEEAQAQWEAHMDMVRERIKETWKDYEIQLPKTLPPENASKKDWDEHMEEVRAQSIAMWRAHLLREAEKKKHSPPKKQKERSLEDLKKKDLLDSQKKDIEKMQERLEKIEQLKKSALKDLEKRKDQPDFIVKIHKFLEKIGNEKGEIEKELAALVEKVSAQSKEEWDAHMDEVRAQSILFWEAHLLREAEKKKPPPPDKRRQGRGPPHPYDRPEAARVREEKRKGRALEDLDKKNLLDYQKEGIEKIQKYLKKVDDEAQKEFDEKMRMEKLVRDHTHRTEMVEDLKKSGMSRVEIVALLKNLRITRQPIAPPETKLVLHPDPYVQQPRTRGGGGRGGQNRMQQNQNGTMIILDPKMDQNEDNDEDDDDGNYEDDDPPFTEAAGDASRNWVVRAPVNIVISSRLKGMCFQRTGRLVETVHDLFARSFQITTGEDQEKAHDHDLLQSVLDGMSEACEVGGLMDPSAHERRMPLTSDTVTILSRVYCADGDASRHAFEKHYGYVNFIVLERVPVAESCANLYRVRSHSDPRGIALALMASADPRRIPTWAPPARGVRWTPADYTAELRHKEARLLTHIAVFEHREGGLYLLEADDSLDRHFAVPNPTATQESAMCDAEVAYDEVLSVVNRIKRVEDGKLRTERPRLPIAPRDAEGKGILEVTGAAAHTLHEVRFRKVDDTLIRAKSDGKELNLDGMKSAADIRKWAASANMRVVVLKIVKGNEVDSKSLEIAADYDRRIHAKSHSRIRDGGDMDEMDCRLTPTYSTNGVRPTLGAFMRTSELTEDGHGPHPHDTVYILSQNGGTKYTALKGVSRLTHIANMYDANNLQAQFAAYDKSVRGVCEARLRVLYVFQALCRSLALAPATVRVTLPDGRDPVDVKLYLDHDVWRRRFDDFFVPMPMVRSMKDMVIWDERVENVVCFHTALSSVTDHVIRRLSHAMPMFLHSMASTVCRTNRHQKWLAAMEAFSRVSVLNLRGMCRGVMRTKDVIAVQKRIYAQFLMRDEGLSCFVQLTLPGDTPPMFAGVVLLQRGTEERFYYDPVRKMHYHWDPDTREETEVSHVLPVYEGEERFVVFVDRFALRELSARLQETTRQIRRQCMLLTVAFRKHLQPLHPMARAKQAIDKLFEYSRSKDGVRTDVRWETLLGTTGITQGLQEALEETHIAVCEHILADDHLKAEVTKNRHEWAVGDDVELGAEEKAAQRKAAIEECKRVRDLKVERVEELRHEMHDLRRKRRYNAISEYGGRDLELQRIDALILTRTNELEYAQVEADKQQELVESMYIRTRPAFEKGSLRLDKDTGKYVWVCPSNGQTYTLDASDRDAVSTVQDADKRWKLRVDPPTWDEEAGTWDAPGVWINPMANAFMWRDYEQGLWSCPREARVWTRNPVDATRSLLMPVAWSARVQDVRLQVAQLTGLDLEEFRIDVDHKGKVDHSLALSELPDAAGDVFRQDNVPFRVTSMTLSCAHRKEWTLPRVEPLVTTEEEAEVWKKEAEPVHSNQNRGWEKTEEASRERGGFDWSVADAQAGEDILESNTEQLEQFEQDTYAFAHALMSFNGYSNCLSTNFGSVKRYNARKLHMTTEYERWRQGWFIFDPEANALRVVKRDYCANFADKHGGKAMNVLLTDALNEYRSDRCADERFWGMGYPIDIVFTNARMLRPMAVNPQDADSHSEDEEGGENDDTIQQKEKLADVKENTKRALPPVSGEKGTASALVARTFTPLGVPMGGDFTTQRRRRARRANPFEAGVSWDNEEHDDDDEEDADDGGDGGGHRVERNLDVDVSALLHKRAKGFVTWAMDARNWYMDPKGEGRFYVFCSTANMLSIESPEHDGPILVRELMCLHVSQLVQRLPLFGEFRDWVTQFLTLREKCRDGWRAVEATMRETIRPLDDLIDIRLLQGGGIEKNVLKQYDGMLQDKTRRFTDHVAPSGERPVSYYHLTRSRLDAAAEQYTGHELPSNVTPAVLNGFRRTRQTKVRELFARLFLHRYGVSYDTYLSDKQINRDITYQTPGLLGPTMHYINTPTVKPTPLEFYDAWSKASAQGVSYKAFWDSYETRVNRDVESETPYIAQVDAAKRVAEKEGTASLSYWRCVKATRHEPETTEGFSTLTHNNNNA